MSFICNKEYLDYFLQLHVCTEDGQRWQLCWHASCSLLLSLPEHGAPVSGFSWQAVTCPVHWLRQCFCCGQSEWNPPQGFSYWRWIFYNEKSILKSTTCISILSFEENYFCLSSSETMFQNMGGRHLEADPKKPVSPVQKRANHCHSLNNNNNKQ